MKNISPEELKRLIDGVDCGEPDDKDFYTTDADEMIGRKYPGANGETAGK